MCKLSTTVPAGVLVGVVGPCSSGKSTLARRLHSVGFQVKEIRQEHSGIPDMWQRLTNPDYLIYLDVSEEEAVAREGLAAPSSWWPAERQQRLAHAREHCDLYVDTTELTPEDVYRRVVQFLCDQLNQRQRGVGDSIAIGGRRKSIEQTWHSSKRPVACRGRERAIVESAVDIPVVAFVGRSGCGKTTLITRLLPKLSQSHVRVAVIKHSPIHPVQTDEPGTDTWRFWDAGAQHVTLVASDRTVHTHRCEAEPPLKRALSGVHDVDLVLVEGYKSSGLPKIEVVREACDPRPIADLRERFACVTDVATLELPVPKFGLEETERLAEFLIARFGLGVA